MKITIEFNHRADRTDAGPVETFEGVSSGNYGVNSGGMYWITQVEEVNVNGLVRDTSVTHRFPLDTIVKVKEVQE